MVCMLSLKWIHCLEKFRQGYKDLLDLKMDLCEMFYVVDLNTNN